MKRTIQSIGLVALAIALYLFPCSVTIRAQAANQQPSQQQQSNQPEQQPNAQQPDQQKSQTFIGQIVKAKNGQFALLMNKEAGTGFYLDNQEKAKLFEGQNVNVTGKLDASRNTILVSDIQRV